MESETSESNLFIVRNKKRCRMFVKVYWRTLFIVSVVILLIPIAFARSGNAYKCFYVFLVTAVLSISDALHSVAVSIIPLGFATLFKVCGYTILYQIQVRNILLDCLAALILIEAIEYSQLHKRAALKILLTFGCSHYRLSFLLFFTSMFLAMWISSTLACGLLMPIVKAVLFELEKLGVVEVYQVIGKDNPQSVRHEQRMPRPTRFTVFYFLGTAYSVSIGELSTFTGSETNQIFRIYCEVIFPKAPNIEFPQFLLLNLPSVLLIETLVYLWMNIYFLGLFRQNTSVQFHVDLSEEESRFVGTLLTTAYGELGKISFHEIVIASSVLLTALVQALMCYSSLDQDYNAFQKHINISSPTMICVVLLFLIPIDLQFLKFFQKSDVISGEPLPKTPGKACLSWTAIRENVDWSILFILGGSMAIFEALKDTKMTSEFEDFLANFSTFPAAALLLVVMVFCKILSEFACSQCVAYCMLPHIARLSVRCSVNPHYLMMGAALCCALPFHLITGTPVNAMVARYVNISHMEIIKAGVGPSLISVIVIWFAVTLWATIIWTDINAYPEWAYDNVFQNNGTRSSRS